MQLQTGSAFTRSQGYLRERERQVRYRRSRMAALGIGLQRFCAASLEHSSRRRDPVSIVDLQD